MDLDPHNILRDTMRALGFLSRFPIPSKWFAGYDGTLSFTCRAFPLASAVITLPASLFLIIAYILHIPPLLAALISMSILIMTTGALHEDGLADVADGFFGGQSSEQRLEIMKDSRIGTYGALALICTTGIRVVALAAIFHASLISAILALIASAAFSRGALVWHWSELESARHGGTSDKVGAPTEDAAVFAFITAISIGLITAILARGIMPTTLAFVFSACVSYAFKITCAKKIGGQTGDTLGASAVLAEIAFLTGLATGL